MRSKFIRHRTPEELYSERAAVTVRIPLNVILETQPNLLMPVDLLESNSSSGNMDAARRVRISNEETQFRECVVANV